MLCGMSYKSHSGIYFGWFGCNLLGHKTTLWLYHVDSKLCIFLCIGNLNEALIIKYAGHHWSEDCDYVAEEKIKVGDLDAATALINVIMTLFIQFEQ